MDQKRFQLNTFFSSLETITPFPTNEHISYTDRHLSLAQLHLGEDFVGAHQLLLVVLHLVVQLTHVLLTQYFIKLYPLASIELIFFIA